MMKISYIKKCVDGKSTGHVILKQNKIKDYSGNVPYDLESSRSRAHF